MSRLRQQSPQNYYSSASISAEFENIIRYLNSAELGNKTIAELMGVLFNTDGEFDAAIEFRYDLSNGLQYRIGEYDDPEEGWTTIAAGSALRGASGSNVGTVEAPLLYNRLDVTPANAEDTVAYAFDEHNEDILVFIDGLLQPAEGVYTADSGNGEVVFSAPFNGSTSVTIYSVRAQNVTNYRRSDIEAAASQAVFPFVHTADERLVVYRNGILQREGGGNDYTSSSNTNTVTFTSPLTEGDIVTIITVENTGSQNVGGIIMEDDYVDPETGGIYWDRILVEDGEITAAKVAGLAAFMAAGLRVQVSDTTPVSPSTNLIWIDTSQTPSQLKFYDGTQFISTTPASVIPGFGEGDANLVLMVNGTGTGLEWAEVDLSALIPKTWRGAANGVASLDADGLVPVSQMPPIYSAMTIPYYHSGSVSDGTYLVQRLYMGTYRIDGIARKLTSGTCNIQLKVDGSVVGTVHSVSNTAADTELNPVIEIDANSVSRRLEVAVTSGSSPVDLEIGIAVVALGT